MRDTVQPKPSLHRRGCFVSLMFVTLPTMAEQADRPALDARRGEARRGVCQDRLWRIGAALQRYAMDKGRFPHDRGGDMGALRCLYPVYLIRSELFLCPSAGSSPADLDGPGQLTAQTCSYRCLLGILESPMNRRELPSDVMVAYERECNHGEGRNVLLGDFSVAWVPERRFQGALHKSQEWYGNWQCRDNVRKLWCAATGIYPYDGRDGKLAFSPRGSGASLKLLSEYMAGPHVFMCPIARRHSGRSKAKEADMKEACDYEYLPAVVGASVELEGLPGDVILLYDRAPVHQGQRHVVSVNGRAELMGEPAFQDRLRRDLVRYRRHAGLDLLQKK